MNPRCDFLILLPDLCITANCFRPLLRRNNTRGNEHSNLILSSKTKYNKPNNPKK